MRKIVNKKHVSIAEVIRQGVDTLIRPSGEISVEERKKGLLQQQGVSAQAGKTFPQSTINI